ncbi:MAG TPA: glycosyltransferase [Chloroflexota bacterium]|nr:glycosyltransferase [Chloroflexota bacterium]
MRVTFVAPFGLGRKGTTRARVLPLAQALAALGHAVRVVVPSWDCPEEWGRRYRLHTVEVIHLPDRLVSPRLALVTLPVRLLQVVLAGRPDVVHCFKPIGYSGLVALGLRWARGWGWRGLLAVDTDDLEGWGGWAERDGRPGWQVALLGSQERLGVRAAQLVTVASRYLAQVVVRWGVRPERVCYLPNAAAAPVPVAVGESSGVGPRLLLYTRFNEFAAARVLQLLDEIFARLPQAVLVLVGDTEGRDGRAFMAGLRAREWARRVECHGVLGGEALAEVLARSDLALWPFEDTVVNRARCPAKLVELLAVGKAVVAEAVGEVEALVGAAGWLVAPGDRAAFVEGVVRLATDSALRGKLERAARRRAEEASWEQRAEALASAYRTAFYT